MPLILKGAILILMAIFSVTAYTFQPLTSSTYAFSITVYNRYPFPITIKEANAQAYINNDLVATALSDIPIRIPYHQSATISGTVNFLMLPEDICNLPSGVLVRIHWVVDIGFWKFDSEFPVTVQEVCSVK